MPENVDKKTILLKSNEGSRKIVAKRNQGDVFDVQIKGL
jgi:hypothetical protein